MSYRSERFNRAMRSLDAMAASRDLSKWPLLSDRGKAADQIRAAPESTYCNKWIRNGQDADKTPDSIQTTYYNMWSSSGEGSESPRERERAERLFNAEMRLVEAGLRHLIPVLLLIADNGSDFHKSIRQLAGRNRTRRKLKAAERLYERHRAALLAFFSAFDKSESADLRRRHAEES